MICHVQVKSVQKKVLQLQKDAEKILRTQMKKYPALQPYARTPYTTIIVKSVALFPFVIFLGPLLGLIASLGKSSNPSSAAEKTSLLLCPVCAKRVQIAVMLELLQLC